MKAPNITPNFSPGNSRTGIKMVLVKDGFGPGSQHYQTMNWYVDDEKEAIANATFFSSAHKMARGLEAIMALHAGEWDNPALLSFGPLREHRSDNAIEIAKECLLDAGYTEEDEPHTPDVNFDNTQAYEEGWALFNDGEIQRLDEGPIINNVSTGGPVFASDEDAIAHVRFLADRDNSEYHKLALSLLKKP